MRQEWSPEELVECWTLVEGDWPLLGNKSGATRLGFAVLLKFFELEGRFPAYPQEVPQAAVEYLAELVRVEPQLFAKYSWSSRVIKYHRAQVRQVLGFRESTRQDEEALTAWLAGEVCGVELVHERLVQALLVRCRAERIEPPGRVERIVAAAQSRFDAQFCAATVTRLRPAAAASAGPGGGRGSGHSRFPAAGVVEG